MAQANTTLSLVCAVYSLLLIFVGTFGGLITFVKCFLKPYRGEPTFVLLAFLRWADIVCLYQWNMKHVLVPFFQINYEGLNLSLCKFSVFMQFYSLKLSAWLLVTIAIERCLKLTIRNWRRCYMNSKKALILGVFVTLAVFIVDMPAIIVNGYYENVNGTDELRCYSSKYFQFMPLWQQMHSYIYSFIPSILLTVLCIILIYYIFKNKHETLNTDKMEQHLTGSSKLNTVDIRLVIQIVLFVIASLPSSVIGVFYDTISKSEGGQNAILLTDQLLFSYHAFNFVLFLFVCQHKTRVINGAALDLHNF